MTKEENKNNKQDKKKKEENYNFKEFIKKESNFLKSKKFFSLFKEFFIYAWKGSDIISILLFLALLIGIYNLILVPIIFPLLFGTKIPFNVVVSESMEHNLPFNEWWQKYGFYYEQKFNITKEEFLHFPYYNGLNIGDVVIIRNYPKSDIKVGDIIVYYVPSLNKYIIHRVVKIKRENNTICFETMGDNNVRFVFYNDNPQLYFEKNVCNIEGKVILKIPYLGLPRFWLYKLFGV